MSGSSPVNFLYKFRACSEAEQRHHLADTLLRQKLWFAARSSLNDPLELKPRLTTVAPKEAVRAYAKYLEQNYSRDKKLSPAKRLQIRDQATRQVQRQPDFLEPEMHRLLGEVGVLCLCESYKFSNMWAHYADNSTGLCLEFDAGLGLFLHAQPVTYVPDYPVANRLLDTNDVLLQKSMFTKHQSWQTEHEWRVIARPASERHREKFIDDPSTPDGLKDFYRQERGFGEYTFPIEALTGIILGEKFSQRSWLDKILDKMHSRPALYQAVTKAGAYDTHRISIS